jgi:hypothetical protein
MRASFSLNYFNFGAGSMSFLELQSIFDKFARIPAEEWVAASQ